MLGEGPHTHFHRIDLVEALHQIVGRNADKARRHSALGHESPISPFCGSGYFPRNFYILGEIEIVGSGFPCHFSDRRVAENGRLDTIASDFRSLTRAVSAF